MNQKILKKYLKYNSKTGFFKWILYRNPRAMVGYIAGTINKIGYIIIKINRKDYQAHRLAWLYEYGNFPKQTIDHINRIKTDNRICNLRDVSQSKNSRNSKLRKDNTSGTKGVWWFKNNKKWQVRIVVNKKKIDIGYFKYKKDAIKARKEAELKYNYNIIKKNQHSENGIYVGTKSSLKIKYLLYTLLIMFYIYVLY